MAEEVTSPEKLPKAPPVLPDDEVHYSAARQPVLWHQHCNLYYGAEKEQG